MWNLNGEMSDRDLRKRKSQPQLGSEVIHKIFDGGRDPLSQQFLRWKLWKRWEDYVGSSISKVSEPVGYRNGLLYVWVKNSTWMQQMVFMVNPIKEKINQMLGFPYVRGIHLTFDRKSVPQSAEEVESLRRSLEQFFSETQELEKSKDAKATE